MKKKTIEKIPYFGLKETKNKDAKYIGVTGGKIIGHEKHLFLEVYRNKKAQDTPLVRIVLTKKDFGTYWPDKGKWTSQKIESYNYCKPLIWSEQSSTYDEVTKENVLQSTEDLERIRKFCKTTVYNQSRWWEYINKFQNNIAYAIKEARNQREYARRKEALNDRMEHTKELPEKRILEEANRRCFHNKHYLYYKKHGSWARIACSKCGGVIDARWKAGDSYESQFQKHTKEPRENYHGTCPMCGELGEYKCQGKVKGEHSKSAYIFIGQKYKENGMVMRYVEVEKRWTLELDGELEMYNAAEELSGVEIARAYFEPGKQVQIDYHKHDPYIGRDFWDDCNLSGISSIQIKQGIIMPETYAEMKDTMFQYSALREYAGNEAVNPIAYLEVYAGVPQLEILVKMNLKGVVNQLVKYRCGVITDANARRPDEFLGIQKERVKQLIQKEGDIDFLRIMKTEKRQNQHWTDQQIEELVETGLSGDRIGTATRYMTIQKLLNRIEKYSGCKYGTGCSRVTQRIRHTATTYTDYLDMRQRLGYDLNNTVYQQPRDLETAHEKMVMETNKEELDKHLQEVAEKYPQIRQIYRKLRKKYFYEDDNYIIRPARSAEEIVLEGRTLHHCVGGSNYLVKHNTEKTYILMVRFKKSPDLPYITVEVDAKDSHIIQWYGDKDTKPDVKNMQAWLDAWKKRLETETPAETLTETVVA